jgi:hypothetical protein
MARATFFNETFGEAARIHTIPKSLLMKKLARGGMLARV